MLQHCPFPFLNYSFMQSSTQQPAWTCPTHSTRSWINIFHIWCPHLMSSFDVHIWCPHSYKTLQNWKDCRCFGWNLWSSWWTGEYINPRSTAYTMLGLMFLLSSWITQLVHSMVHTSAFSLTLLSQGVICRFVFIYRGGSLVGTWGMEFNCKTDGRNPTVSIFLGNARHRHETYHCFPRPSRLSVWGSPDLNT